MKHKPVTSNFFRNIAKKSNDIKKQFEEKMNAIDNDLALEQSWEKIEESDVIPPEEKWQLVTKPNERISYAQALKRNLPDIEKNADGYVKITMSGSGNQGFGK
ncbi:MAG: hypothetical protein COV35_10515 [Alphaproteobacteria bacterium CG11_big_fil_rev_8_21_14_0_20_39_49]|nr:MAG: hypothetical protein COV35_10515 [Alphaproteobacteria bacterium CG11_big_fil_rev_8_21_14_0_20_39_49]